MLVVKAENKIAQSEKAMVDGTLEIENVGVVGFFDVRPGERVALHEFVVGAYTEAQVYGHLVVVHDPKGVDVHDVVVAFMLPGQVGELHAGEAGDAEVAQGVFVHVEGLEGVVGWTDVEGLHQPRTDGVAVRRAVIDQVDLAFFCFSLHQQVHLRQVRFAQVGVAEAAEIVERAEFGLELPCPFATDGQVVDSLVQGNLIFCRKVEQVFELAKRLVRLERIAVPFVFFEHKTGGFDGPKVAADRIRADTVAVGELLFGITVGIFQNSKQHTYQSCAGSVFRFSWHGLLRLV